MNKRMIPGFSKTEEPGVLISIAKGVEPPPQVSLDYLVQDGLVAIRRIMDKILADTTRNILPPRETVMTLKDCMAMVTELKRKQIEAFEGLTAEELKRVVKELDK